MKLKSIFVSMFALAALASCSNDDEIVDNGSQQVDGEKAYISLNVLTPSLTRANTIETGTGDESAIKHASAIFFNSTGVVTDVQEFSAGLTAGTATEAFKINSKATHLLLLTNETAATELTDRLTVGESFSTINAALTTTTVAKLTTVATGFTMANEDQLVDITTNKKTTKAEAEAAGTPAVVKIDRVVSKVQVKTKGAAGDKNNGVEVPTDANFSFTNWALSITNKSMFPLSERIAYKDGTTTAVQGVYRKDNNWTITGTLSDYIKNNFNVISDLKKGDFTWLNNGIAQYCMENTMDADNQKKGVTTKAVISAEYTPKGITKGASYFTYGGKSYTYADLKKYYDTYKAEHEAAGMTTPDGVWKDADAFATALNGGTAITFGDATEVSFAGKGYLAKGVSGGMRYYENSICYYEAFIHHDATVPDMKLGRWGVVRNNWYELTINKVSGPGTPWIPDPINPDPTDPSQPNDPDDDADTYISVSVTVNPWTFWKQGVDL